MKYDAKSKNYYEYIHNTSTMYDNAIQCMISEKMEGH